MAPAALTLVAYSAQIVIVVCVATLGAILLRISTPAVRLAYWRAVGLLCLALPFLQMASPSQPAISVAFETVTTGQIVVGAAPAAAGASAVIVWMWITGVAIRFLWLLVGAWALTRLRRDSVTAALDRDVDAMRLELAPRAEFRWSDRIRQPVTFGATRPVIFLPRGFGDLDADARHAVACHELLHVARRDWLWIVLEEHLRALFWFHPGVWWVVEQVQLAREQVIDRFVVTRTASKSAYMAALMAFADGGRSRALAIAFLRRRHLTSRFQQLSKESHMPWRRLAWTVGALALVLGATAVVATRTLPLDLDGLSQQSGGATRLEIRLAETAPATGLTEATVGNSNQRIYLHPETLATQADVTSARVIDLGGGQSGVSVTFSAPASERMRSGTATHLGRPVAIVLEGRVVSSPTVRAPISDSAVISGVTADAARSLASRLSPGGAAPERPGNGVTLPVPVHQQKPYYPPAAMDAGLEGRVLLEAVAQRNGTTGTVTVVRSLDSALGLDQAAVDAMKQWTWKPGTKDGKPVDVAVQVEMTFTLK